jgi:hypothetical protein
VGGEPLLLPENERLLDVVPSTAIVTLITNLNVDLEKNKIFRKLSTRNKVGWSMSFDNIGKKFEYVRHGSNWELMKQNVQIIKELMTTQGQWGGIHAVYNIYNATNFTELREFAEEVKTSVLWQNLFQPKCLDPFLHGPDVAKLAAAEIEKFYATGVATPVERQFFDQALEKFRSITQEQPGMTELFKAHIEQNETEYHRDQAGNFVKLWPELAHLCK